MNERNDFGLRLDLDSLTGRVHPDYNIPDFIRSIRECPSLLDDSSCRILEDSRNRIGVISLPLKEGKMADIVIKEFRTQGVDKLKSFFQASKALRAWRGSSGLVNHGLETPLPVAFLEKRTAFFLKKSFFLSEFVSGVSEIRSLFREYSPDDLEQLTQELAGHLARCIKAGIDHRDLSDGNILVKKDETKGYLFYLLDTNRIRCKKKIGILRAVKSLIRLGIPPDHRQDFLARFLSQSRVSGWLWRWYRINKVSYTKYIVIKRALGLKKIAQKLKIQ